MNQAAGTNGVGMRFCALLLAGVAIALLAFLPERAAAGAGCGREAGKATSWKSVV